MYNSFMDFTTFFHLMLSVSYFALTHSVWKVLGDPRHSSGDIRYTQSWLLRPDTYAASCHKLWLSSKLFAHGFGTVTVRNDRPCSPNISSLCVSVCVCACCAQPCCARCDIFLSYSWIGFTFLVDQRLSVRDLGLSWIKHASDQLSEFGLLGGAKALRCKGKDMQYIAEWEHMRHNTHFILIILFGIVGSRNCVCVFSEIQGKALVRKVSEQMEGGWKANRKWKLDDFLMLCWQQ